MLSITGTQNWKRVHPDAIIGLLEISGVDNTRSASALEAEKYRLEVTVRERYQSFERNDFRALPVIAAYHDYYKHFKKTYHVLQQVESIALKGKSLPKVSPLVDANFAAEMETLLLTAGHDVEKLKGEIYIDIAAEGDTMTQMNGARKSLYATDMVMKDDDGVCCSIIYGQDNSSPITRETTHALFIAYAPAGLQPELVEKHLRTIESYIHLFAVNAITEQLTLLKAKE